MKKNNRGIAVFTTLMFLFLISLIAVAVLLTAYNYNNICEGQLRRTKALTLAEAGINYACWQLRVDPDSIITPPGPTITNIGIGGANVEITVTGPVSGRYTISSKAEYQKTVIP